MADSLRGMLPALADAGGLPDPGSATERLIAVQAVIEGGAADLSDGIDVGACANSTRWHLRSPPWLLLLQDALRSAFERIRDHRLAKYPHLGRRHLAQDEA